MMDKMQHYYEESNTKLFYLILQKSAISEVFIHVLESKERLTILF